MAWKPSILSVSLLHASDSIMHLFVLDNDQHAWLLSVVYGSCNPAIRNNLWNALSDLNVSNVAGLLVGDFNCTLAPSDKKCGTTFCDSLSVRTFSNLIFV